MRSGSAARSDSSSSLARAFAAAQRLVDRHQPPDASRLQAADSLSLLEVNAHRPGVWVREGQCTLEQARAKLDWTLERISIPAARALAEPLDARAVDTLTG